MISPKPKCKAILNPNQLIKVFYPPLSHTIPPKPKCKPILNPNLSINHPLIQRLEHLLLLSKSSPQEALSLYQHLHSSIGFLQIPPFLLPSLLKAAAASPSHLPFSLQLHSLLLKTNLISHPRTLNSLITTYSKHSEIASARKLFDTTPLRVRDRITWSSMLKSYIQNGRFHDLLHIYKQMCLAGVEAKPELIAAVVSACGRTGSLSLGRAIHAQCIARSIVDESVLLPTSLIDMYARCGDLGSGLRVLNFMGERNVVTWTAVINGCVLGGRCGLAIELVRGMGGEGVEANGATVFAALSACAELAALKLGKEMHGLAFRRGFESDPRIVICLIDMYSRCAGAIGLALLVFERAKERDTITWSSMMAAFSRTGDNMKTFELFYRMKRDNAEPNSVTMLAVIDACIGLQSLDHSRAVLGYILKSGLISDVIVGNSLINMFAKCGCIESSRRVFSELMPARDSISYSSMIQSYGSHGHGHDALCLFKEMHESGFKRDGITLFAILSACSHSGLIEDGKRIFESVKRHCGAEHYACYVDLLGKGGMVEEAREVVRGMPVKPSARILSSLISSCRVHGRLEMAEELARELAGLEPTNAANYRVLSMVYADGGNWEGVEEVWRVMRERGLRMNKVSAVSK